MAPYNPDDIDALLEDTGVDVTYSGTTVKGLLDQEDIVSTDPNSGIDVVVRSTVCRIKTGALTPPTEAVLTADGTSYRVREARQEGDGGITVLVLAAV